MPNHRNTKVRGRAAASRMAVASAVLMLGVTGCGISGQESISSDTSCREYFNYPAGVRHDAAIKISVDVASSSPGNPMWGLNTDAACGSNPNATVGEVLGQRG